MSTQVKRRRGTAAENAAFTGAIAELVFLTDSKRAAIHDAIRAGGYILPTADDLLNGALTRGTASGTNTYALTLPFFPTSYSNGLEIDVTFTSANTTSCTLNVNSVGATGMKNETGTNFTSGQIGAGSRFTFRHNGTEWRRISGAAGTIKTVKRQVFTTSGTYTPSTGMLFCDVEVVGGGGGGGGINSASRGCSGGGAGGYSKRLILAAEVGASITVSIGAAGSGGATSGGMAAAGGTTSFGSIFYATGGVGGQGYDINLVGAEGGSGFLGNLNMSGTQGQNSYGLGSPSGCGGSSMYGSGGQSRVTTAAGNAPNGGFGGGGAGAFGNGVGGWGTSGIVIITEYCS